MAANGVGRGRCAWPNTASIMSSVPARQRGVASGMRAPFQNSGPALSVGVFFSVMIAGLASSLPRTLTSGLERQGVSHAVAQHLGSLPPVSSLFAAVLGVNPLQHLLAANGALAALPAAAQRTVTGKAFFPDLISGPFHQGLLVVFAAAAGLPALAALASLLRCGRPDPAAAPDATSPPRAAAPQPRTERNMMALSTLDPKPARVVIDLQKGILALPVVHPVDEIVQRAASLAAAFRRHHLPVVLVNVTVGAPWRTEASRPAVTPPPDRADLVEELDAQPDDHLISEQRGGAVPGTP